MQKSHLYCLLLVCTTLLLFFTGCNKLLDYFHDNPDGTTDACQIKKLVIDMPYYEDPVTVDFTYHSWGGPVSFIQAGPTAVRTDGYFRYDNKRRLTDYIMAYKNGHFEGWRRFVYDNNNRIVRDTSYSLGIIGENPSDYYLSAVTYYTYDAFGRIIHTKQVWAPPYPPEAAIEQHYTYDVAGNLVKPGVVYDNKLNPHRTNAVWMFIDRNYSVNNAYATAYNNKHLPVKTELVEGVSSFFNFTMGTADISYKCK